jgi:hypothetical protein
MAKRAGPADAAPRPDADRSRATSCPPTTSACPISSPRWRANGRSGSSRSGTRSCATPATGSMLAALAEAAHPDALRHEVRFPPARAGHRMTGSGLFVHQPALGPGRRRPRAWPPASPRWLTVAGRAASWQSLLSQARGRQRNRRPRETMRDGLDILRSASGDQTAEPSRFASFLALASSDGIPDVRARRTSRMTRSCGTALRIANSTNPVSAKLRRMRLGLSRNPKSKRTAASC